MRDELNAARHPAVHTQPRHPMHRSFSSQSLCSYGTNAKLFSINQANTCRLSQISWQRNDGRMNSSDPKPFSDISQRLKWHRNLEGLTQAEYAERIGIKRSAYSLWEAGSHRLSLDGALALRRKYGLSLDFMYEGIDDALPMTLRRAWQDRP